MTKRDYPSTQSVLEELYGTMQTFRGLGFPADGLFIVFGVVAGFGPYTGRKCVGVRLLYRGQEFNYHVAPVKNGKKFGAKWVTFAERANNGPADDPKLNYIVEHCYCREHASELLMHLALKGIEAPLGAN